MTGEPEAIQAALILEERAARIIQAALSDKDFMRDVQEAQQAESRDEGEPWPKVKARLGLV